MIFMMLIYIKGILYININDRFVKQRKEITIFSIVSLDTSFSAASDKLLLSFMSDDTELRGDAPYK